MIKQTRSALLGLFLAILGVSEASAVTYQAGDLFLGFRATGAPGSTKDYLVNIGQASQFTAAAAPLTLSVGDLATDLNASSLFDSNWKNRADVFWSISGPVGQFAAVGADPAKTLYATRPRLA